MSRTVRHWLAVGLGLLLTATPLLAHHNITGKFDPSKTRTLKGVVTKLDWANPHVHVTMNVKTQKDRLENWNVEFASPGGVIVAGLMKDWLKPGAEITIKGYPSRKPSKSVLAACATEVTMPDGLTVHFVVGI